jgi:hypothetical protein
MPLNYLANTILWQKLLFRLPSVTLCLSLAVGALILSLASWHSDQLANEESERLGQALSAQLVEAIRQPILNDDLVSLQASVEYSAKNPDVYRASILDSSNEILAERDIGKGLERLELSHHRAPVTIEGNIAAYAEVDINVSAIKQRNSKPLWWISTIWLLFTILATTLAFLQGRNLSDRISALSNRLPDDEELITNGGDELAYLEHQLDPLLSQSREPETSSNQSNSNSNTETAVVSLHCKTLERLQAQLTQENMRRIYAQLNRNLEKVSTLYNGERLNSCNQTLFIEFRGESANDDHPLRALFCATIMLQLVHCQADLLGVSIELSASVTLSRIPEATPLELEFALEQRKSKGMQLAQLGSEGELLTDQETYQHSSVLEKVHAKELIGKPDIFAINNFSKVYRSLLEKQFRYLAVQKKSSDSPNSVKT